MFFSLTNPGNTPLKLKVNFPENAVCHFSNYGPTFGGGYDLHVSNLSDTNRESYLNLVSYEFPNNIKGKEGGILIGGSDHNFQTVKIEVFQVV